MFAPLATPRERRLRAWMYATGLLAMPGPWLMIRYGPLPISLWPVTFAPTVAIILMVMVQRRFSKALRSGAEHLRAVNFHICPRCTYDLEGVIEHCPECGHAFDTASLRRDWTSRYGTLVQGSDPRQPANADSA